jgi:hypothetical protein
LLQSPKFLSFNAAHFRTLADEMMNSILFAGDTCITRMLRGTYVNYKERKRQAALPQEGTMKVSKSPKQII